jgi:hypothetical protein
LSVDGTLYVVVTLELTLGPRMTQLQTKCPLWQVLFFREGHHSLSAS